MKLAIGVSGRGVSASDCSIGALVTAIGVVLASDPARVAQALHETATRQSGACELPVECVRVLRADDLAPYRDAHQSPPTVGARRCTTSHFGQAAIRRRWAWRCA